MTDRACKLAQQLDPAAVYDTSLATCLLVAFRPLLIAFGLPLIVFGPILVMFGPLFVLFSPFVVVQLYHILQAFSISQTHAVHISILLEIY
jgi:hypothetical protein